MKLATVRYAETALAYLRLVRGPLNSPLYIKGKEFR